MEFYGDIIGDDYDEDAELEEYIAERYPDWSGTLRTTYNGPSSERPLLMPSSQRVSDD